MANANTKAKTQSAETAEEKVTAKKEEAQDKKIVAKEIDPEQYVTVRNGFHGRLVYRSKRTGEKFVWEQFGDEQDMTLRELKNAKNSSKKFFTANWFLFDEQWIPEYLGVGKLYKYALTIGGFDDIFKLPANELKSRIAKLSDGQKGSVRYRAMELIKSGDIDSLKTISVLEEMLGVELTEK